MKKLLTVLLVIIATLCTAFAFTACDLNDLFGNNDNDGNTADDDTSSSGGDTTGGDTSSSGSVSSNNNTAHTCTFVFTQKVDGCVTNGYNLFTCKDPACGKTEKQGSFAPVGHNYQHKTFAATCTSDWAESDVCSRCGDEKNRNTLAGSKTAHNYVWTETKTASCTADGSKSGVCSDCGATDTASIPASGHSYGAYKSDNNASCTHDATETAICADCGNKDIQTIPNTKAAHSYGAYTPNNDASCTHDATETAVCADCGHEDVRTIPNTKAAHSYGAWKYSGGENCLSQEESSRQCTVCDYVDRHVYDYGAHSISGGKCTLCGEVLQQGPATYDLIIKDDDGVSEAFGKVYFEFNVLTVGSGGKDMTWEMCIFQEYTVNGQDITAYDNVEFNGLSYEFTLLSVADNSYVTFSGWFDYDVYGADHWATFIIGGSGNVNGNNYSYMKRYYVAV